MQTFFDNPDNPEYNLVAVIFEQSEWMAAQKAPGACAEMRHTVQVPSTLEQYTQHMAQPPAPLSLIDELVREYLFFRGAMGTVKAFEGELRQSDKLYAFRVDAHTFHAPLSLLIQFLYAYFSKFPMIIYSIFLCLFI